MFKDYILNFLLKIFNDKFESNNYFIFKNHKTNELYFIVTIENNNIEIIDIAPNDSLENQVKYLFSTINFDTENSYKRFIFQKFSYNNIECIFVDNKCEGLIYMNINLLKIFS